MKNFRIIMFIFFIWTIDLQSSNDNIQLSTRPIQSNQRRNQSANNTFARPPLQQSAENDNVVDFVRKLVIHGYEDKPFILAMGPRADGQPSKDRRAQDIYGTTKDFLLVRLRNKRFYDNDQVKDDEAKITVLLAHNHLKNNPNWQNLSQRNKAFQLTAGLLPSIHYAAMQNFPEDTQTNSQNQLG